MMYMWSVRVSSEQCVESKLMRKEIWRPGAILVPDKLSLFVSTCAL